MSRHSWEDRAHIARVRDAGPAYDPSNLVTLWTPTTRVGSIEPGDLRDRARFGVSHPVPRERNAVAAGQPPGLPHGSLRSLAGIPPAAVTTRNSQTLLWVGAAITAAAAIFFPRIEGIREQDESWWRLALFFVPQDVEGIVLVPIVVGVTIVLFVVIGRWAWRDRSRNRPATVGLICSLLGLVGILLFFLSAPIILGGLGTTLGIEGTRRTRREGREARALTAIIVGVIAFAIGAGIWVFAEELGI